MNELIRELGCQPTGEELWHYISMGLFGSRTAAEQGELLSLSIDDPLGVMVALARRCCEDLDLPEDFILVLEKLVGRIRVREEGLEREFELLQDELKRVTLEGPPDIKVNSLMVLFMILVFLAWIVGAADSVPETKEGWGQQLGKFGDRIIGTVDVAAGVSLLFGPVSGILGISALAVAHGGLSAVKTFFPLNKGVYPVIEALDNGDYVYKKELPDLTNLSESPNWRFRIDDKIYSIPENIAPLLENLKKSCGTSNKGISIYNTQTGGNFMMLCTKDQDDEPLLFTVRRQETAKPTLEEKNGQENIYHFIQPVPVHPSMIAAALSYTETPDAENFLAPLKKEVTEADEIYTKSVEAVNLYAGSPDKTPGKEEALSKLSLEVKSVYDAVKKFNLALPDSQRDTINWRIGFAALPGLLSGLRTLQNRLMALLNLKMIELVEYTKAREIVLSGYTNVTAARAEVEKNMIRLRLRPYLTSDLTTRFNKTLTSGTEAEAKDALVTFLKISPDVAKMESQRAFNLRVAKELPRQYNPLPNDKIMEEATKAIEDSKDSKGILAIMISKLLSGNPSYLNQSLAADQSKHRNSDQMKTLIEKLTQALKTGIPALEKIMNDPNLTKLGVSEAKNATYVADAMANEYRVIDNDLDKILKPKNGTDVSVNPIADRFISEVNRFKGAFLEETKITGVFANNVTSQIYGYSASITGAFNDMKNGTYSPDLRFPEATPSANLQFLPFDLVAQMLRLGNSTGPQLINSILPAKPLVLDLNKFSGSDAELYKRAAEEGLAWVNPIAMQLNREKLKTLLRDVNNGIVAESSAKITQLTAIPMVMVDSALEFYKQAIYARWEGLRTGAASTTMGDVVAHFKKEVWPLIVARRAAQGVGKELLKTWHHPSLLPPKDAKPDDIFDPSGALYHLTAQAEEHISGPGMEQHLMHLFTHHHDLSGVSIDTFMELLTVMANPSELGRVAKTFEEFVAELTRLKVVDFGNSTSMDIYTRFDRSCEMVSMHSNSQNSTTRQPAVLFSEIVINKEVNGTTLARQKVAQHLADEYLIGIGNGAFNLDRPDKERLPRYTGFLDLALDMVSAFGYNATRTIAKALGSTSVVYSPGLYTSPSPEDIKLVLTEYANMTVPHNDTEKFVRDVARATESNYWSMTVSTAKWALTKVSWVPYAPPYAVGLISYLFKIRNVNRELIEGWAVGRYLWAAFQCTRMNIANSSTPMFLGRVMALVASFFVYHYTLIPGIAKTFLAGREQAPMLLNQLILFYASYVIKDVGQNGASGWENHLIRPGIVYTPAMAYRRPLGLVALRTLLCYAYDSPDIWQTLMSLDGAQSPFSIEGLDAATEFNNRRSDLLRAMCSYQGVLDMNYAGIKKCKERFVSKLKEAFKVTEGVKASVLWNILPWKLPLNDDGIRLLRDSPDTLAQVVANILREYLLPTADNAPFDREICAALGRYTYWENQAGPEYAVLRKAAGVRHRFSVTGVGAGEHSKARGREIVRSMIEAPRTPAGLRGIIDLMQTVLRSELGLGIGYAGVAVAPQITITKATYLANITNLDVALGVKTEVVSNVDFNKAARAMETRDTTNPNEKTVTKETLNVPSTTEWITYLKTIYPHQIADKECSRALLKLELARLLITSAEELTELHNKRRFDKEALKIIIDPGSTVPNEPGMQDSVPSILAGYLPPPHDHFFPNMTFRRLEAARSYLNSNRYRRALSVHLKRLVTSSYLLNFPVGVLSAYTAIGSPEATREAYLRQVVELSEGQDINTLVGLVESHF